MTVFVLTLFAFGCLCAVSFLLAGLFAAAMVWGDRREHRDQRAVDREFTAIVSHPAGSRRWQ